MERVRSRTPLVKISQTIAWAGPLAARSFDRALPLRRKAQRVCGRDVACDRKPARQGIVASQQRHDSCHEECTANEGGRDREGEDRTGDGKRGYEGKDKVGFHLTDRINGDQYAGFAPVPPWAGGTGPIGPSRRRGFLYRVSGITSKRRGIELPSVGSSALFAAFTLRASQVVRSRSV